MLMTKTFDTKEELLSHVNGGHVKRQDIVMIEAVYGTKYRLWYWMTEEASKKVEKASRPKKHKRGPTYPTKDKAKPCPYNEAISCNTEADCTGCGWMPKTKDALPEREPTLEEIT